MDRIVNTALIEGFINAEPRGAITLLYLAKICDATLAKVRRGKVPSKGVRARLASALGLTEDELFPVAATIESKAS